MKIKLKSKTKKFPKDFLWGASTSAYQVEGGIETNDWALSKKIAPAGIAADHYKRYREDFKYAKTLNHNAHRLSLEWSRLEPEPDVWNNQAFDHYLHVLKTLKDHGFTTFVTLHHFTNPDWIANKGGWLNRDTVAEFNAYVSEVAYRLGSYIDFWITINEPNVYAAMSYVQGIWPPYQKKVFKGWRVYKNLLAAHNQAYEIIHGLFPLAEVGFAQNIAFNEPKRPNNFLDKIVVKLADWLTVGFPYARTRNDFLGINHYFHHQLKFGVTQILEQCNPCLPNERYTEKGWEIYPQAMYEVLKSLKKYDLPVYITENGIADSTDRQRFGFIKKYLLQVHRAIKSGVKVKGYLYWSLLDNYEWPVKPEETGFETKFGLVAVDFQTQKRKVRKSARQYAKICKSGQISLDSL